MSESLSPDSQSLADKLSKKKGYESLLQGLLLGEWSQDHLALLATLLENARIPELEKQKINTLIDEVRAKVCAVDTTFRVLPVHIQKKTKAFIDGRIKAELDAHSQNPTQCVQVILSILKRPPDRETIEGVFRYFSAPGMLLVAPLHLVGMAILQYYREGGGFKTWVDGLPDGFDRLISLQQVIEQAEAELARSADEEARVADEKARQEAEVLVGNFAKNYKPTARAQFSEYLKKMFTPEFFRQRHLIVTYMAQVLDGCRVLKSDEARWLLAEALTSAYNASEGTLGQVEPDMILAMESLQSKLRRLNKKPQPAPARRKVEKPKPVKLEKVAVSPDKQGLSLKLKGLMRNPNREQFLVLLRRALAEWGPELNISPDPQDVSFRAAGGQSLVINMKTLGSKNKPGKPFIARFNIESAGEGADVQEALALAKREERIGKKVKHVNIVEHSGLKALPIELPTPNGMVPVSVVFQHQELIDRASSGHEVIDLMQRNRIIPKPGDMIELMDKLGKPIAFLHQMDVVHRDVKPDNVMIVRPPDWKGDFHAFLKDGLVKYIDFGFARDNTEDSAVTVSSVTTFPGTPGFIAPECYSDGTKTRNKPNDVYALGITLYYFMTGQHSIHPMTHSHNGGDPFDFSSPTAAAQIAELATRAENGEDIPSIISLNDPLLQPFLHQKHAMVQGKEVEKTINWKIARFVMRMCDPNPAKRPTMEEYVEFTESNGESCLPDASPIADQQSPQQDQRKSGVAPRKPSRRISSPEVPKPPTGFIGKLFGKSKQDS